MYKNKLDKILRSDVIFPSRSVEVALVNTVLSDLSTLETEISLHTEAVLSGRLNEEQLKLQFLQQQQFLTGSSPISNVFM